MKETILFLNLISIILFSCSESDKINIDIAKIPSLNTIQITNITSDNAISGGNNIDNGGSSIIAKGLCWSISQNPTINDNITNEGIGIEDFTSSLSNLSEDTTYYVKAYATNEKGTGYGNELTFTTELNVNAPCSPQTNSIIFDSSVRDLGGAHYVTSGLFYGDYGVKSSGLQGDLNIEFSASPETGIYPISSDPFFMTSTECAVTGVFKIFGDVLSHRYTASSGTNAFVYVVKTGTDQYSMTFCNLHFASGSIPFTFSNSNGNLTTTF